MNRALIAVLAVQFLSALGDNALVFAAIALLNTLGAPAWQIPVLQQSFVAAFILLAPFVGHLADALPKGRVMAISNAVKALGCIGLLAGLHPLAGYACVGVGAALYSPAKYGILSELFPAARLVWANGWMEGITVSATILGALLGGALVSAAATAHLQAMALTAPMVAVLAVTASYLLSTVLSGAVPRPPPVAARRPGNVLIDHPHPNPLPEGEGVEDDILPQGEGVKGDSTFLALGPATRTTGIQFREFGRSLRLLWADEPGRVSIILTSLFWGVGTTLRFVILAWTGSVLHAGLDLGAQLTAAVMVGIGLGAAWAGSRVPLDKSFGVVKYGCLMGLAVMAVAWVGDWIHGLPLLLVVGALGGYLVVPMNAVLQHRGHLLVGAGHSIALQNLGENLSILLMLGAYALLVRMGVPVTNTILLLGAFVVAISALYARREPDIGLAARQARTSE